MCVYLYVYGCTCVNVCLYMCILFYIFYILSVSIFCIMTFEQRMVI